MTRAASYPEWMVHGQAVKFIGPTGEGEKLTVGAVYTIDRLEEHPDIPDWWGAVLTQYPHEVMAIRQPGWIVPGEHWRNRPLRFEPAN